jgi:hypothetical protein
MSFVQFKGLSGRIDDKLIQQSELINLTTLSFRAVKRALNGHKITPRSARKILAVLNIEPESAINDDLIVFV